MRSLRWPFLLVVVASFAPRAVHAQMQLLTGTVRDSATSGLVPGVVVTLDDSVGHVLTRTLTDERGVYRIKWSPLARTVRMVRIGFRPRVVPAPALPNVAVDVRMIALPTLLEAVTSRAQQQCPKRADRQQAFALWEQARLALLATVVGRESSPLSVERSTFDRVLGIERRMELSQIVESDTSTTATPFVAVASAATLVRDGFQSTRVNDRLFYAPDADVLLDDAFIAAYCLQFALATSERPNQMGLTFSSANTKRGRVDIAGTVWVDTAKRTLVDLGFRYRGLEDRRETNLEPGGYIGFETMPNGIPIVARWTLRLVSMREARTGEPRTPDRRGVLPEPDLEVHEMGGEVTRARMPNGSEWAATLGTLRGRVVNDGAPVPDVDVHLIGTPYSARSDSKGVFEITNLLPGRYIVATPHSALNEAGFELTLGQALVVARSSVTEADVELPSERDFVGAVCGNWRAERITIPIRVLTSDGDPAIGARVRINGKTFSRTVGGHGYYWAHDGVKGSAGTIVACNLLPAKRYDVTVDLDGLTAAESFERPPFGWMPTHAMVVRLSAPIR